eukprot:292517-Chlamydomonas_euryale.AAC.1
MRPAPCFLRPRTPMLLSSRPQPPPCHARTAMRAQLLTPEELDARAAERISGEPLKFLDGQTLQGLLMLNKVVRKAMADEKDVFTKDNARFIHGGGVNK